MTGEMSKAEVTRENFPHHFAVADALGGTVHPFDQYQGPYVSDFPNAAAKLWLSNDDGVPYWYNSVNGKASSHFHLGWTRSHLHEAVIAAREVL